MSVCVCVCVCERDATQESEHAIEIAPFGFLFTCVTYISCSVVDEYNMAVTAIIIIAPHPPQFQPPLLQN